MPICAVSARRLLLIMQNQNKYYIFLISKQRFEGIQYVVNNISNIVMQTWRINTGESDGTTRDGA